MSFITDIRAFINNTPADEKQKYIDEFLKWYTNTLTTASIPEIETKVNNTLTIYFDEDQFRTLRGREKRAAKRIRKVFDNKRPSVEDFLLYVAYLKSQINTD